MNVVLRRVLLCMVVLALTACGADYVEVYDDGHSHYVSVVDPEPTYVVVREPVSVPLLESFAVVDSYGSDSDDVTGLALEIDPYIDSGWFEVYWYAQSRDDYWVEFYIGDSPIMESAVYVGSQLCGEGLECEQDGLQFCQYSTDFYLSCDTGEDYLADVSPLVYAIPQTLYFFVQVCDVGFEFCEYDVKPLLFN